LLSAVVTRTGLFGRLGFESGYVVTECGEPLAGETPELLIEDCASLGFGELKRATQRSKICSHLAPQRRSRVGYLSRCWLPGGAGLPRPGRADRVQVERPTGRVSMSCQGWCVTVWQGLDGEVAEYEGQVVCVAVDADFVEVDSDRVGPGLGAWGVVDDGGSGYRFCHLTPQT